MAGGDDDDGGGTPTSPLEYAGVLKFPTATKKRKKIPRKNVSVTLEDSSVPAVSKSPKTSLEPKTFKVTGLSNIKPFKVQVTSTTVSPQLKKTVITSSSSSLDDMLSVAKKKCKYLKSYNPLIAEQWFSKCGRWATLISEVVRG